MSSSIFGACSGGSFGVGSPAICEEGKMGGINRESFRPVVGTEKLSYKSWELIKKKRGKIVGPH